MNARQLEVFCTIMRCGTLTAAASVLNVSQPALSQILLHTEDQLGLKLFRRLKGRLLPTPEAEQLYPEAERLFRDLDRLRRLAGDLKRGDAGVLRLAASAPPSLSILPYALKAFRAVCPGVRLISHVVPVDVIYRMLDGGEADIGIAMNDMPRPLIETETIGRSEIVCLMRTNHPLVARRVVGVADLAGEPLVTYGSESLPGMKVAAVFAREGIELRPTVEIEMSVIALSFVQHGIGVALVDALVPWSSFAGVTTRPFRPTIPLPLCMLASSRRAPSRSQTTLRALLRDAVRQHQRSSP